MDTVQAIVEYRAARAAYMAAARAEKELADQLGDASQVVYHARRAYETAETALLIAAQGG